MSNYNYGPPMQQPPFQPPTAKKTHKIRNFVVLPIAGLIAIIAAANAGGSNTSTSVTPQAVPTSTGFVGPGDGSTLVTETPFVQDTSVPDVTCSGSCGDEGRTEATVPTEAPKPKPTVAPLTVEQENAVQSAKSYLDFGAFSRKGLIRQLSSDAGEGYPLKVATFAVDSLHINYNEQAAKSAKEYLTIGPFSRNGLIEQLSSDAGEGFTHSQAVYGVNKAGL